MKRLLLLFLLAIPAFAQPTVTSVVVSAISHSTALVTATSSLSVPYMRINYGTTSGYGDTLNQGNVECTASSGPGACPNYQIAAMLSGLAPSTTYHIQMQASTDGVTWGSSSDTSFTTTALPGTHPAYPIAPATFSSTTPTTFAVTLTAGSSPGCSTLQACINTASAEQYTAAGNIEIVVTAGTTVNVGSGIIQPPIDANAATFTSSSVNTTASTITITTPPHGSLAANQGIRLAVGGGGPEGFCAGNCLPTWNASLAFPQSTQGGLVAGQLYYVINPSSGCSTNGASCTFQIASVPSGSPIALTDQGSGTNYVTLSPPAVRNAIVIRTSTPDGQFCPSGTFCQGSVWSSLMAKLEITGGLWTNGSTNGPLLFQSNTGAHDYYFVGLEMTQADASSLAATSVDPMPTRSLVWLNVYDAPYQIVFDRDYIHGLGLPNRLYSFAEGGLDGANIAMVNTDQEHWDYWRPWVSSGTAHVSGFAPTISGMQVTTANGSTFYGGPALGSAGACTSNNLSITFTGGSVTGTAIEYFALSPTCTPTYVIPTGETATCAGTGSDGTNTRACSVLAASSPSFPADSNGSQWGGSAALAEITLTSGTPTNAFTVAGGPYPSVYWTEGTQGFIAGWGPGPFQFVNNTISGAGLLWHFDDSSSGVGHPGDYLLQRNRFTACGYQTGTSTNYDYGERNPLEWKNGQRALLDANTWTCGFAAVSLDDSMFTLTPRGNATETDFEIRNNTQNGGNFFLSALGGLMTGGQQAPNPLLRVWVHNNLINSPNGYTNFSQVNRPTGGDYAFFYGYAMEDIRTEHNTVYNPLGPDPSFMHWLGQPEEGQVLQNNLLFFSNDTGYYGMSAESISALSANTPNCGTVQTVSLTNACMLQGSTPFWLTGGNVMVPLYANTYMTPSGIVSAATTCTTQWGGSSFTAPISCAGPFMAGSNSGTNYLEGDTTTAARLAGVDFTNPSGGVFSLAAGSNWKGMATDSTDPGVAWSTLQNAQGVIQSVTVSSITASSATVTVVAPDMFGCDIDVGSPGFTTTFTRFTQAGGSTMQVTNLTGLPPGASLQVRADCAAQQPTANFSTAASTPAGNFVAPVGMVFPFVP